MAEIVGEMRSWNCTSRSRSGLISSPGQPTFRCTWLNALTVPICSPVVKREPRFTRTCFTRPVSSRERRGGKSGEGGRGGGGGVGWGGGGGGVGSGGGGGLWGGFSFSVPKSD